MPHKRKLQPSEEILITEAYEKGSTLRELAKFYKVSQGTVRNTLIRRGAERRRRGRNRKEDNNDN